MKGKQTALFEDRFLESFTGLSIMKDPKVAIMELIANAWDAGATSVKINWPVNDGELFSIADNGHGMTEMQFEQRFRTLAYNRSRYQGIYAEVPDDNAIVGKRPVFGKNGKGRFAGFSFGPVFFIKTWKENKQNIFKISVDKDNSLAFQKVGDTTIKDGHGTEVYVEKALKPKLSLIEAKAEIGMRFLTDPHFEVLINQDKITFNDIPKDNVEIIELPIEGLGNIKITVIDSQSIDKTSSNTASHGMSKDDLSVNVRGRVVVRSI